MNITPQILTVLVGGIIAAFASFCAVMLTGRNQRRLEEARWRREDQARFHLYRRELYARFLSNVSTAFQSSSVLVQFQSDPIAQQMAEYKEQKQLLVQSMTTLPLLWEEVGLVGSASVVSVAQELNGIVAIFRLGIYLPTGKAMIENAQKQYLEILRPGFLDAARNELGLPPMEKLPRINFYLLWTLSLSFVISQCS
jgi:hypothetical protein